MLIHPRFCGSVTFSTFAAVARLYWSSPHTLIILSATVLDGSHQQSQYSSWPCLLPPTVGRLSNVSIHGSYSELGGWVSLN